MRASVLAAYLGVTQRTVLRWIQRGLLPAWQAQTRHYSDERPRLTGRGAWRVWEADLERFLRERRYRGAPIPERLWR